MLSCEKMMLLMNDYMDEQLCEADQVNCDQHLVKCPNCLRELNELKMIQEVLQEVPMKALPENFAASLHEKLLIAAQDHPSNVEKNEKSQVTSLSAFQAFKSKTTSVVNSKRTWQLTSFAAVACLAIVIGMNPLNNPLTQYKTAETMEGVVGEGVTFDAAAPSGGGAPQPQYGVSENVATPEGGMITATTKLGARMAADHTAKVAEATPKNDRAMIYNGSINIEVKSQTEATSMIKTYLTQKNGYIENSSFGENPLYFEGKVTSYQKFGNLVLRVPAIEFENSYDYIKSLGKVTNETQYTTDVTQIMTDLEASIKNLEARELSLRTLMKQAKNITEIMSVDKELTAVRTEIDQLKMSLRQNESAVNMSTLNVTVTEVTKLSEQLSSKDGTFIERAFLGLSHTLQYMLYWVSEATLKLIALLPILFTLAVIGSIIYKLRQHLRGGKKHE